MTTPAEVEAVARAIWIAGAIDVMNNGWPALMWDNGQMEDVDKEPYRRNARAAIAALDAARRKEG